MCYWTDVCFMCTNDNNCSVVDNEIVTQVEYLLPEITVIKLGIPLGICSSCEKHLHSFSKFKQACLENTLRLEAKIKDSSAQAYHVPDTQLRHLYADNTKTGPNIQECVDILPLEVNIKEGVHSIVTDTSNTVQCVKNNAKNFEQIYIKEEPIDDCEDYSDTSKKVLITDSSENTLQINNTDWQDYCCSVCKISFTLKSELKNHRKYQHSGFQCSVCNKLFTRKSVLQIHLKIHSGIKDFHCDVCGKTFTQKVNLLTHMKRHNDTKEYACSICNRLFTHNSTLINHMKIHNGIKNFKCTSCDKQFIRKDHLEKHSKIHSGVKDYQCHLCEKMFVQKNNLKAHLKTHI